MTSKKVLKYAVFCLATLAAFAAANSTAQGVPFAASLFAGLLYAGAPALPLAATFILSFIVFNTLKWWIIGLTIGAVLGGVFIIYGARRKAPRAEFVLYFIIAMLPYMLIDGFTIEKALYSAIICLFSFITAQAAGVLRAVGKRAKPGVYEVVALAVVFIGAAVGGVRLYGVELYSAACVLALLIYEKMRESASAAALGEVLAFPIAIVTQRYEIFCVFFLWFAFSAIFVKRSKTLAALGLVAAEALSAFLFGFYADYSLLRAVAIVVPALFFAFLPDNIFSDAKRKFGVSGNEQLVKNFINRSRVMLSSRLYEMSGVFFNMQSAFTELKKSGLSAEQITEKISAETLKTVCSDCTTYERCRYRDFPSAELMHRLIALGLAKGRVTLIDMPREFVENCSATNGIIFEINRLLSEFSSDVKDAGAITQSKELMSLTAEGLARIMKGLAFETSKIIAPDKALENAVYECMKKSGYPVFGILTLGENEATEISVFTDTKTAENPKLAAKIGGAVGAPLTAVDKTAFSDKLVSVTFKKSPSLDAVFGVTSMMKDGSAACGDTHSLIKIDEGKFLIALSDGMGSGERARTTSSTSLNLIESFYRAGLESELILSTVNKVLSISVDDNFAAVDIGVVDLYSAKSDFIKIGAPYGLILSENGIRFIEGSSLPLGILDELKPSTATLPMSSGDVIVMLSDGITDAFGSSSDVIEFLKSAPLLNPQALSDTIVERALRLSGGSARDDMTALCVRIVDKIA